MRSANRNVATENFRGGEARGWAAVVGVEAEVIVADVLVRDGVVKPSEEERTVGVRVYVRQADVSGRGGRGGGD